MVTLRRFSNVCCLSLNVILSWWRICIAAGYEGGWEEENVSITHGTLSNYTQCPFTAAAHYCYKNTALRTLKGTEKLANCDKKVTCSPLGFAFTFCSLILMASEASPSSSLAENNSESFSLYFHGRVETDISQNYISNH